MGRVGLDRFVTDPNSPQSQGLALLDARLLEEFPGGHRRTAPLEISPGPATERLGVGGHLSVTSAVKQAYRSITGLVIEPFSSSWLIALVIPDGAGACRGR